MKTNLLTATFGLALALAFFGCGGGDDGGNDPSSSSNYISSSSNYEADSSSSEGEGTSSSGNDEATSSSSGDEIDTSSSSEGEEDISSSSNDDAVSSSSGDEIDTSSSSEGEEDISSSSNDEAVSSSSAVTGNSSSSESNIQGGFENGYFIDPRDGKRYKYEVASTGQIWMSENLNYSRDNTLGYCYGVDINGADPHRDSTSCDNGYGRVYKWETAMDGNNKQGLCPNGWHIPSKEEWSSITDNPEYCGSINMSDNFCISSGNYNTNSEYTPLGWKERDNSGFYWTSSGYNHFAGLWYCSPTRAPSSDGCMDIQSSAGIDEYFSIRCITGDVIVMSDKGNDISNYRTVTIGNQVWMAENLNYAVDGSKCYGEGNYSSYTSSEVQANCDTYGRLYDWATAMNLPSNCNNSCASQISEKHQGICPSGWHIPNDDDWDALFRYVDGTSETSSPYDSPTAGRYLKATSGWNNSGNGQDTYGFAALPGGYGSSGGSFSIVGIGGYWWSATQNGNSAYNRRLVYNFENADWLSSNKTYLFSVRCVKD